MTVRTKCPRRPRVDLSRPPRWSVGMNATTSQPHENRPFPFRRDRCTTIPLPCATCLCRRSTTCCAPSRTIGVGIEFKTDGAEANLCTLLRARKRTVSVFVSSGGRPGHPVQADLSRSSHDRHGCRGSAVPLGVRPSASDSPHSPSAITDSRKTKSPGIRALSNFATPKVLYRNCTASRIDSVLSVAAQHCCEHLVAAFGLRFEHGCDHAHDPPRLLLSR